jgi:hypothetical protein
MFAVSNVVPLEFRLRLLQRREPVERFAPSQLCANTPGG